MFKLVRGTFEVSGRLIGFDCNETLYLTFDGNVDVTVPAIPERIAFTMRNMGLLKLSNSVIDLNTGQISIIQPLEATPGQPGPTPGVPHFDLTQQQGAGMRAKPQSTVVNNPNTVDSILNQNL